MPDAVGECPQGTVPAADFRRTLGQGKEALLVTNSDSESDGKSKPSDDRYVPFDSPVMLEGLSAGCLTVTAGAMP